MSFQADSGLPPTAISCSQAGADSAPSPFLCFPQFPVTPGALRTGAMSPSPPHQAATRCALNYFPSSYSKQISPPGFISVSFLFTQSSLFHSTCFYPYNKLISSAISQSYIMARHRTPSLPEPVPPPPS